MTTTPTVDIALPDETSVFALAELFKVLGDPTRVRIVSLLQKRELCVHEITEILGVHQTTVSHQLKTLRHTRLVKYRREGRHAYYSLDDDHVEALVEIGLEHIRERTP
jgi:ArsR family transcriptional regulator